MTPKHDTSTASIGCLEDEAMWYDLYQWLRKPVRYWVHMYLVPSWVGQEDDLIEDIVQEALVRTWQYLHKTKQGRAAPVKSVTQFSRTVAYNYCRDLRRRDCRLTSTRNLPDVISIFLLEIVVDPQEIAIERISQDEVFASVARIIGQFPAKQRRALLADLARRMDLRGHPTALQQAFLNEGIRLEEYQQPLSEDAGERNRYLSALSTAYKRLRSIVIAYSSEADPVLSKPIKRQQKLQAREDIQHDPDKVSAPISKFFSVSSSLGVENMSSQTMAKTSDTERYEAFMREITHMNKSEKEQADKMEEQDAPMILEDPELARLALHLRQTPPPIDPAYRAALQSRLLEIVHAQRPRRDGEEVNGAEIELETKSEQNTQSADARKSINDEPDTAALEDEAELEFLACHLQQTIPPVPIDPRFRAALQEKLLEVVRRPTGAAREKRAPDILSLKSGCPI